MLCSFFGSFVIIIIINIVIIIIIIIIISKLYLTSNLQNSIVASFFEVPKDRN